jgi:hypothetical protein
MHIFEATNLGFFKRYHFDSNQNSASSDELSINLIDTAECIEKVTS